MCTLIAFSSLLLLLHVLVQCRGLEGAPGAEGCPQGLVQGPESAAHGDVDSNDESLWKRILKIIADRGVLSSGSQREDNQREGNQRKGKHGKDMGAPFLASEEEVAHPAASSQLASAPSSADALPSVGI